MRDKTERPEGLEAGTLKVIGTDETRVFEAVKELIDDEEQYLKMSNAANPYGDGLAGKRIIKEVKNYFQRNTRGLF